MKKITKLLLVLILSSSLNTVNTQANIFIDTWNSKAITTVREKTKAVSSFAWNKKSEIALTLAGTWAAIEAGSIVFDYLPMNTQNLLAKYIPNFLSKGFRAITTKPSIKPSALNRSIDWVLSITDENYANRTKILNTLRELKKLERLSKLLGIVWLVSQFSKDQEPQNINRVLRACGNYFESEVIV